MSTTRVMTKSNKNQLPTPNQAKNNKLIPAISHCINIKSVFDTYAYKLISHDQFVSEVLELVELLKTQTNKLS